MADQGPLLTFFQITNIMECIADPGKLRVVAELTEDVSPVFPYINAALTNVMYNPGAGSLTIRRDGRILTFYAKLALLAKIIDEDDAREQLDWWRSLCNETWKNRETITPLFTKRTLLGAMDAYLLLPKLNCKECGEATCMAFGAGIIMGLRQLGECGKLAEPPYREGGRRLSELLGL